jgi:hypothetical protein
MPVGAAATGAGGTGSDFPALPVSPAASDPLLTAGGTFMPRRHRAA